MLDLPARAEPDRADGPARELRAPPRAGTSARYAAQPGERAASPGRRSPSRTTEWMPYAPISASTTRSRREGSSNRTRSPSTPVDVPAERADARAGAPRRAPEQLGAVDRRGTGAPKRRSPTSPKDCETGDPPSGQRRDFYAIVERHGRPSTRRTPRPRAAAAAGPRWARLDARRRARCSAGCRANAARARPRPPATGRGRPSGRPVHRRRCLRACARTYPPGGRSVRARGQGRRRRNPSLTVSSPTA